MKPLIDYENVANDSLKESIIKKPLLRNVDPKESPNPTNFSNLRSQGYLQNEKENECPKSPNKSNPHN